MKIDGYDKKSFEFKNKLNRKFYCRPLARALLRQESNIVKGTKFISVDATLQITN